MTIFNKAATGATCFCYCWVVRSRDGTVLALTDHDQNVTVDGVECLATTGMVTSQLTQSLGLDADDVEVRGVIDDDILTSEALRSGIYDNARVTIYIVDWTDPTDFYIAATGTFGNAVETDSGGFMTEFRSMTYALGQTVGRSYQRTCDAKLGDSRCGVDLSDPQYTTTATVISASQGRVIVDSLPYGSGWFSLGKLTGPAGQEIGIREQVGTTIALWGILEVPLVAGDTVTLVAGCKQDVTTCRSKFDNVVSFRGFPFIPGNDALTSYPVRGKGDYDGGSIFE